MRRRLMELAAELFPLQLSGCCAVLRPPQLLAHPPVGVDDAASISDISHCCPAEFDRRRSQHCFIFFAILCFFFKFRIHSRPSRPRQHRWDEMKQGSGATSTEKLQELFFSRLESGQRAEREKDKTWDIKEFVGFFLLFFSVEAPVLTAR